MKTQLTELRLRIDLINQLVDELWKQPNTTQNSSELQLCSNSLRLAKARLGKILGLFGEDSPYQNDGKRKTVEDIEPASDKAVLGFEGLGHAFKTKQTFVEKIDWLREKISEVKEEISLFFDSNEYDNKYTFSNPKNKMNLSVYSLATLTELDNARFYLGFELGRIREENKPQK